MLQYEAVGDSAAYHYTKGWNIGSKARRKTPILDTFERDSTVTQ
jgi:hypothetical protein